MSFLRTNLEEQFSEVITDLNAPWSTFYKNLHKDVPALMHIIGDAPIDISGVWYQDQQYNMAMIATLVSGPVSNFLKALHGLFITCTSGVLNPLLTNHLDNSWLEWLLKANICHEPAFLYICHRSLKTVAQFLLDEIETGGHNACLSYTNAQGETALHIAVRKRQWQWAKTLIAKNVSPYQKNKSGESALMLVAPFHDKLEDFKVEPLTDWYNELHDTLPYGRQSPEFCRKCLELGADFNQVVLYDSPAESLQIFAEAGLDMNLGPLPELSAEQRRIIYMHGRRPDDWKLVLDAFQESEKWPGKLFALHSSDEVTEDMRVCLANRRAISQTSLDLQKK